MKEWQTCPTCSGERKIEKGPVTYTDSTGGYYIDCQPVTCPTCYGAGVLDRDSGQPPEGFSEVAHVYFKHGIPT